MTSLADECSSFDEKLHALERATQDRLCADARARVARLSQTEWTALKGILFGQSARDLASELALSLEQAAQCVVSVRAKLGAVTNADAVRIAIYAGLDEFDQ